MGVVCHEQSVAKLKLHEKMNRVASVAQWVTLSCVSVDAVVREGILNIRG